MRTDSNLIYDSMLEINENDEIDDKYLGMTSEILSPSLPQAANNSESANSQEVNMLISGDNDKKKKVKGIKLVMLTNDGADDDKNT